MEAIYQRVRLKSTDLVKGEPVECPACESFYMVFIEKLKSGRSGEGTYRRRRFRCGGCGHTEVIHAEGMKDIQPFVREKLIRKRKEEKLKEKLKAKFKENDSDPIR